MVKKDRKEIEVNENEEIENDEKFIEEQESEMAVEEPKTYQEILASCGQSTMCQIRRGDSYLIWTKIPIAYEHF